MFLKACCKIFPEWYRSLGLIWYLGLKDSPDKLVYSVIIL